MKKELQVGHFCFSNPKESNSYSDIYLSEPSEKFLEKFGRLVILTNINFAPGATIQMSLWAKEWIEKLTNLAKNNFYNTTQDSASLERNLENLLQQLNIWLSQEKVSQPKIFEKELENYDLTVILIKNKEIQFSKIGEIRTCLIENNHLEELDKEEKQIRTTKFANIVSGNLEKNNVLFFTNQNLFDYFSVEKIIQILDNTPLEQIKSEFKKILNEDINHLNILGVAMSYRPEIIKTSNFSHSAIIRKNDTLSKKSVKEPIAPKANDFLVKRTKSPHKNWATKILLVALVLCALTFVTSLFVLDYNKKIDLEKKQYAQTLIELEDKKEQLDIAILSSATEAPKEVGEIFKEIELILNKLPIETEKQEESFQFLYSQYIQKRNEFYKITDITNPLELIDLSLIDENIQVKGCARINENLYVFNPENNNIYRINPQKNETEAVNETSVNVGYLEKIYQWDNDNLIGYDQNQNLIEFNTIDNELFLLPLVTDHKTDEIVDLQTYSRKLYVLRPSANQIYKYQKIIDGFGKEQAWIKDENVDISQSLSLAIDGSIYVLQTNGQIIKLHEGKRIDFNLSEISPRLSLEKTGKIFTNDKLDNLYILDKDTQRIVIIDKTGELIRQFTFNNFTDLKDFAVSDQEDKIWVLNKSKIFEIEL